VALLYWILKVVFLGPLLRLVFRPRAEGLEHVPEHGAAILASNHLSFSDSFFLPLVVPRRVTFLAKSDYFTGPGIKGWLTARFFRGVGQVPVDRSGGRASEAALRTGLRIMRDGQLLGIYPEGTRSPDGRLYRGRTGVARMALEAGVPVIPVAMIDTEKIQPPGKLIPKVMRVGIRFGKPLDFSRYEGLESDRFVLRSMTDEIMYELMMLSGQEYVDMYAQKAKKDQAGARKRGGEARRTRTAAGQEPAGAAVTGVNGSAGVDVPPMGAPAPVGTPASTPAFPPPADPGTGPGPASGAQADRLDAAGASETEATDGLVADAQGTDGQGADGQGADGQDSDAAGSGATGGRPADQAAGELPTPVRKAATGSE
jgi:1-acyl-sn-glycerol-3-phosphate acyltransferase